MPTQSFSATGAAQTFTVPIGVTSLTVNLKGAAGAAGSSGAPGQGAVLDATLAVTPGEILQINVGTTPSATTSSTPGGFNGGGAGSNSGGSFGGGGGGATDIRRGANALADRMAAAGGGGGSSSWGFIGGNGGGPNGTAGQGGGEGGGGSTVGGGYAGGGSGTPGTLGQGGAGGSNGFGANPGGGGGGLYGGGGGSTNGANYTGGGGGGSSLVPSGATVTTGGNTGTGSATLTYVSPGPPVAGNWRNGSGTLFPNLFTSPDGLYQVGVLIKLNWHLRMGRRNLTTGLVDAIQDLDTVPAAINPDGATSGPTSISPILSDALGGDVHYSAACALDSQHRIWLGGNSLSTSPHLLRSSPANGTWPLTWTAIGWPWPGVPQSGGHSLTGADTCTYHNFARLGNGDLLHYISQREASGAPEGADSLLFRIPAGSDNHVPLIGNGEFAISAGNDADPTTPDRVYLTAIVVEQYPHKDRVWVMGDWRLDWTDVTTQIKPWLVYNDTVTNAATWKAWDGSPVTMPLDWVTSGGLASTNPNPAVAPTVPLLHGPGYFYGSSQLWIDWAGHPHFIHQQASGTVAWWHVWHDGTTWVDESVPTSSNTPSMFVHPNGAKVFWRRFSGRIQFNSLPAATTWQCGNPVPTGWDITAYDPIQAARGRLHFLLPDGDNFEVCTFGDHAVRARAS